jgi:hypothetical protein
MNTRSLLVFLVLLISPVFASANDCGAEDHRASIQETVALIVKKVPVRPVVGEFLTEGGTHECVRLSFFITPWGRAKHIRVAESSGEVPVEMAAADALRGYKFKGGLFSFLKGRTLVFDVVANKFPKGYFRTKGRNKRGRSS